MKKLMTIGLVIVFLIAAIISAGVILSVRNVNVTYVEYSGLYEDEYEQTRSNLEKLKGSGLLFVSEEDIEKKISDGEVLSLKSYEKRFPCSIDIVIEERVECFAVKTETGYSVYDSNGEYIKTTSIESSLLNTVDHCPNVVLDVDAAQIKNVARFCSYFNQTFGALRRPVEKIYTIEYSDSLILNLRSGLSMSFTYWKESGEQKVKKAYEKYLSLTDAERVKGSIIVDGKDGLGLIAEYH